MKILFLLLFCLASAMAVLPPEHQKQLLCPAKTCLKRKNSTVLGPRRMNHVCVSKNGFTTAPISVHPSKRVIVDRLLRGGYHSKFCAGLRGLNDL
jgi:hypothetical protein